MGPATPQCPLSSGRGPRRGRWFVRRRQPCGWLLPVLLAGCVTTYEDAPLLDAGPARPDPRSLQPVTIPIAAAPRDDRERALLELYQGVLLRMQEAAAERQHALLAQLVADFDRSDLPDFVRGRIAGYRAIAAGLRFLDHAKARAALRLQPDPAGPTPADPPPLPDLGAPLALQFALPAAPEPVRLGGRDDDDPTGFQVAMTVEDLYVDGSTQRFQRQQLVWLPAAFDLAGTAQLELPLALDLPPGPAVQRQVLVRVDLLPGYLAVDGQRAPVGQTTLAAWSATLFPPGAAAIQRAPLAALREALRLGDPAHFPHVLLAARFAPAADREAVLALLVDVVRLGRPDQAQVAMAALRAVTGVTVPLGDRDAWLAWWQLRR